MRHVRRMLVALTALSVVALSGCGGSESVSEGDSPQQATATTTVQEPAAVATDDPCLEHAYDEDACREKMEAAAAEMDDCHPDDANCDGIYQEDGAGNAEVTFEEPEPERDDAAYNPDFEVNIDGARWSDEGARVRISRLALRDRDDFCSTFDEFDEPEACYDDLFEGETIIALDMRVVNKTGRDIEWYADQAELVLGSEQIESDLLGPDDIGGTFRAGTEREGQAWWLSDQSVDEIEALGEMRLIMGTPNWSDDYESITGDYGDIDLTITW